MGRKMQEKIEGGAWAWAWAWGLGEESRIATDRGKIGGELRAPVDRDPLHAPTRLRRRGIEEDGFSADWGKWNGEKKLISASRRELGARGARHDDVARAPALGLGSWCMALCCCWYCFALLQAAASYSPLVVEVEEGPGGAHALGGWRAPRWPVGAQRSDPSSSPVDL